MAEVNLKHIEKVYPHAGGKKPAPKKHDGEKKGPNLKVTDEGVVAVEDFNLDIADHEFVVLVGPSGCGKSTTLRMVAGLEEITRGELYIDGKLMNDVAPKDRDIAMVFQSYALYPHMTVRRNLSFALDLAGVDKREVAAKVDAAARILELQALLERKPRQLSGGQRQRVAIGRAIVRNPKIFLFDEPLSNLDAALRVQMRLELARLHQELAATMIYVTHDQVEAMTLADKVVVLNGGRVEQVGSPLELYHHPANLFVAGFLGTPKMGFLRGHLSRNQGERCEVALECGARVGLPLCAGELATGSPVTLGIRPEHLNIARPGHAFQGLLRVAADVSERLGSDSFCHVRADSGEMLTLRVRGDFAPDYGAPLELGFDPAHCHLFDSNGQALDKRLQQAA